MISSNNTEDTTITDLGMDVMVEIVSRVAEGGIKDLLNARSVSKLFNNAGEYNKVYHNVVLSILSELPWFTQPNDGRLRFLQRIRECKNPEVTFSEGVMAFFADDCFALQRAEDILTISAFEGHLASIYTLGLLKVMKHDQSGVEEDTLLLTQIWDKRCLMKCRHKLIETARGPVWLLGQQRPSNGLTVNTICKFKGTCKGWRIRRGIWVLTDETDDYSDQVCINCRLDEEVSWYARNWKKAKVYY